METRLSLVFDGKWADVTYRFSLGKRTVLDDIHSVTSGLEIKATRQCRGNEGAMQTVGFA